MTLKCLIVDDEPLAHKVLEKYISKLNTLSLAGNCYNALEAIDFLHSKSADIIFLDINMPEMTGLDFLKTLSDPPVIIITSAYSDFALESYDFGVLDYLLKPIAFDRFLKAVNRIIKLKSTAPVNFKEEKEVKESAVTFIFLKADGVQHKVFFTDINYLESKGNFVQFYLQSKKLLVANTLRGMEEQLTEYGFLRVHKSYIINTSKIKGLEGNQIILGNVKIPIGNSYRQVVLSKLGFN